MKMNPLQKRVVELVTEDVDRWEKAAEDTEGHTAQHSRSTRPQASARLVV